MLHTNKGGAKKKMTCANWILTVLAVVVLVFTIWPAMLSSNADKWIIIIASVLAIIIVWTGTNCKWCEDMPKKRK